jgi:U4/U6 small nuclear ribonucleoprotein PRP4
LQDFLNSVPQYDIIASQYVDTRCVSRGDLSTDGSLFATSGWSGDCKIWSIPDCEHKATLKGHNDRAICIKFHPDNKSLATCSADKTIKLW